MSLLRLLACLLLLQLLAPLVSADGCADQKNCYDCASHVSRHLLLFPHKCKWVYDVPPKPTLLGPRVHWHTPAAGRCMRIDSPLPAGATAFCEGNTVDAPCCEAHSEDFDKYSLPETEAARFVPEPRIGLTFEFDSVIMGCVTEKHDRKGDVTPSPSMIDFFPAVGAHGPIRLTDGTTTLMVFNAVVYDRTQKGVGRLQMRVLPQPANLKAQSMVRRLVAVTIASLETLLTKCHRDFVSAPEVVEALNKDLESFRKAAFGIDKTDTDPVSVSVFAGKFRFEGDSHHPLYRYRFGCSKTPTEKLATYVDTDLSVESFGLQSGSPESGVGVAMTRTFKEGQKHVEQRDVAFLKHIEIIAMQFVKTYFGKDEAELHAVFKLLVWAAAVRSAVDLAVLYGFGQSSYDKFLKDSFTIMPKTNVRELVSSITPEARDRLLRFLNDHHKPAPEAVAGAAMGATKRLFPLRASRQLTMLIYQNDGKDVTLPTALLDSLLRRRDWEVSEKEAWRVYMLERSRDHNPDPAMAWQSATSVEKCVARLQRDWPMAFSAYLEQFIDMVFSPKSAAEWAADLQNPARFFKFDAAGRANEAPKASGTYKDWDNTEYEFFQFHAARYADWVLPPPAEFASLNPTPFRVASVGDAVSFQAQHRYPSMPLVAPFVFPTEYTQFVKGKEMLVLAPENLERLTDALELFHKLLWDPVKKRHGNRVAAAKAAKEKVEKEARDKAAAERAEADERIRKEQEALRLNHQKRAEINAKHRNQLIYFKNRGEIPFEKLTDEEIKKLGYWKF